MREKLFRLLVKKISKELNIWQEIKLFIILLINKEARKEYDILRHAWNEVEINNPHKIQYDINDYDYTNSYHNLSLVKLAIAASIVLFVLLYTFVHPKTYIATNTSNKPKTIILPDKSKVTLDTNATVIYYVSRISGFNRKVKFSGRAYFEISKLNGKTFTITCRDACVQVLGTKFNLVAIDRETSITLVEGKVKVYDLKNLDTALILKPNQKLVYIPSKRKINLSATNTKLETFWLENKLIFNQFTITEIAQILKKYYGKTLVFDTTLYINNKISGSAPTDDYHLIIEALAYITHSTYSIKNDTIYLKHQKN